LPKWVGIEEKWVIIDERIGSSSNLPKWVIIDEKWVIMDAPKKGHYEIA
jgi:hypothetical protein